MQELDHEDGEVLEAVGVDRHGHRLDRGRGPQLDLTRGSTQNSDKLTHNFRWGRDILFLSQV